MQNRYQLKVIILIVLLSVSTISKAQSIANIHYELDSIRLTLCPQASFSFWAESVNDSLINSTSADSIWPTASAIKMFILPAFYQEFKSIWDTIPVNLDSILDYQPNYQEPLDVFSASERMVIDSVLSGFTYKQIGEGMMGKVSLGNDSYNACANIAIFLLGGPASTTLKIQNLNPEFSNIRIGRYMLDTRTDTTDNINSIKDFAILFRMLHQKSIPNLQASDYPELLSCIWTSSYNGYTYYQKSGGLTSFPAVKSRVGFILNGNNMLTYALNLVAFNGTNNNFSTARADMTILLRDRLLDSNIVTSNNAIEAPQIEIYPNPASDFVFIKTNEDIISVKILNELGMLVADNHVNKINIKHLPSGIYFMIIQTKDKNIRKWKFIKE
jgi:hypothetical protein